MNPKRQQTRLNDETRHGWDSFASHRNKVAEIVTASAKQLAPNTRLPSCCILGAGNGNDLDLAAISNHFSSIHLFDIDSSALRRIGQRYQELPEVLDKLVFEDPVDVTAVFDQLEDLKDSQSPQVQAHLIEAATKACLSGATLESRTFDVVVSTCLLSQLIGAVVDAVGNHEQAIPLILAVRDGHLNLLYRLTGSPGRAVLINDFVSSDTLPQLSSADDEEKLLIAARQAINDRNFFTGTNPWSIIEKIRPLLDLTDHASLEVSPPWRWQLGPRYYAVTAINFSKH